MESRPGNLHFIELTAHSRILSPVYMAHIRAEDAIFIEHGINITEWQILLYLFHLGDSL